MRFRNCQKKAYKIIEEGINLNKNVKIEMPCNSGKSLLIVKMIQKFPDNKILILIPRIILLEQWEELFDSFGIEYSVFSSGNEIKSKVLLCVYGSFEKVEGTWDNVVIDEAHHIEEDNEIYIDSIRQKINEIQTTLLSATFNGEVDYRYSIREAINDKIICDYQINLPVLFGGCAEDYGYSCEDSENDEDEYGYENYDEGIIEYLINHPEYRDILCFCNTTERVYEFNGMLVKYGYKSSIITPETKKKDRVEVLNEFRKGKIRIIVSNEILNEGIILSIADTCLFVDKQPNKIIQSIGRVLNPYFVKTISHVVYPIVGKKDKDVDDFLRIIGDKDEEIKKLIENNIYFNKTNRIVFE